MAAIPVFLQNYIPIDSPSEIYPLTKKNLVLFLGLASIYLLLQVRQHWVIQNAAWVADSVDYIFTASNLTVAKLFAWPYAKPWGAAILYRLTGDSPRNIDFVQTLLSAIAWLSLAWAFARSIRTPFLKLVSVLGILALSLTDQVQMWNHVILSESLSISLMVLILSLWLSLIQRWNVVVFIALSFALVYWINTREANLYLCLLIAIGIFLFGLIKRNQRFYWLASAMIVLASLITLRSSERLAMPRWAFSLTNVILQRILPQPEYVDFFANHGMPTSPELKALEGGWANSNDFAVFNDAALNKFEHWLYARGKETYALFLLRFPGYTLISPLANLSVMMAVPNLAEIYELNYRPLFPGLLDNLLFPIQWFGLYMGLCLVLIAGVLFIKPWNDVRAFWLIALLVILWVPHIFLVWHADAMEIERHAVQANIQFRLAMWLLAFLAADVLILHRFERRGHKEVSISGIFGRHRQSEKR